MYIIHNDAQTATIAITSTSMGISAQSTGQKGWCCQSQSKNNDYLNETGVDNVFR